MTNGYNDLVAIGDRLVGAWASRPDTYEQFGTTVWNFTVVSRTHARCDITGKLFKICRRGNNANVHVGGAKIIGRI